MFGELVPTGGGDPIPLLKARITIGRRDSCDIALQFPNVSSQHCELELINGYWRIRDVGSRNGIKVNGSRVDSVWLLPGDEVSIAKHAYEIRYKPQGEAPPPENEDIFSKSLLERAGLSKERTERPRPANPPKKPVSHSDDETVDGFYFDDEPAPPPRKDAAPKRPEPVGQGAQKPESDDTLALKWLQDGPG